MYSPEAGDGNYQSGFRSVEAADEKLCGGRSRGSSPCDSLTRGGDSNICWTRIGDSALESSYYLVEENTTSLRPKKEGKKKKERKKEQEVERRSVAGEKKKCWLQSWMEQQVILGRWPRERHLGQVPHQHSCGLRATWPRRASPSHGLFCLLLWAKWSPFLP